MEPWDALSYGHLTCHRMLRARQPTHPRQLRRAEWLGALIAASLGLGLVLPGASGAVPQRLLAETEAPAAPGETGTPPSEGPSGHQGRAERRLARRDGCKLTMSLTTTQLTAGEPLVIVGSLACATAAEAAEQTVSVFQREAGVPGFAEIGTASTEGDGDFQFTTAAIDANSTFYVSAAGTHSAHRLARVASSVSIAGPPTGTPLIVAGHHLAVTARSLDAATFTGTVSPAETGARVVLQRERAGASEEWRRIGTGEVASDGTYSIAHTFAIPGAVNIRVVVRDRGHNVAGASEPISYEVAQHQNPHLTIYASAPSLAYGQSVTISGLAVGAPNQQLTLLTRSRGGAFTSILATETEPDGSYSFPAQTPTQGTFYKVLGPHIHSASLFEAVSPQLTAEPSSSSVSAGTPVRITGTITPDHAGQTIYLERRSPSGVGFQVIALATVAPDSSYTLEHTFFAGGPQMLRVKVPGTAESAPAASELLAIQIADASSAALQAKLPSEAQL